MPVVWLVIPVHGRAGITRVCLEQKRHLVGELASAGVESHVLVVGDDENLDTARELDFQVLERPNALARKLNDGFAWACTEGGADFVSFVGSDDWMLPAFMADLPAPDQVRTSKWIAFVSPKGDELIVSDIQGAPGNAPWVVPAGLLEPCGYRPFQPEKIRNGMDGALARSLAARRAASTPVERGRANVEFRAKQASIFDHRPADELRAVDFKGTREQMTAWSFVSGRRSRIRYESDDPWATLATRYPLDLVESMQRLYAEGRA